MDDSRQRIALKFEHVTVSFNDKPALEDVSFETPAGDTRILFGAAGSGKTVLLKTALGLLRPNEGRVSVFGQDITGLEEAELFAVRSKIGMLFQESALFDSMTIEDNVAYPLLNQPAIHCTPEEVERRVKDALRFVELERTLAKFPSELSGGMRRRVGVARAVVTDPPMVLFDSPTAGLDPITANTIIKLIVKQREVKRTTTLIVTHRYQNGNLLANYHYDPDLDALKPNRNGFQPAGQTRFLGFREGKLIFDGNQRELEDSRDPYVSKFVMHNG
ncbi:MAG TPA: ATP-binding cassette domain-containing protein [Bryobacteraceae bacterium]|nr:ATP-binding cassette domain-containing protein [Bryobacteraceae bacterium]